MDIDQKNAIYQFILSKLRGISPILPDPRTVLFYYLDNPAVVANPVQLEIDQLTKNITSLQTTDATIQANIVTLQKKLDDLKNPPPPPPPPVNP